MEARAQSSLSFASIAYLAPVYLVSVGMLYLWAYWGSFHINILEHASIADVVKASAEPIASTFFFWVIGSIIGQYVGSSGPPIDHVEKNSPKKSASRSLRLSVAFFTLSLFVLGFFTSRALMWLFLPMVAAAFAYRLPSHLFNRVVPRNASGRLLTALAIALPFFAFAQGKFRADEVQSGRQFTYLHSIWPGIKDAEATAEGSPRLLGRAGANLFFLLPKNDTVAVVFTQEGTTYQLRRFKTSVTSWQRMKEWFTSTH